MSRAEAPAPIPTAEDASRPFAREDVLRRVASMAELEKGARVLEVGAGAVSAALWLAKHEGCEATVVGVEPWAEAELKERAVGEGVAARVTVRPVELGAAGLREGEYNLVLVLQRRQAPLEALLRTVRPLLARRGRLCLCYPVRVGRVQQEPQVTYWEKELGEPLLLPRDLMGALAAAGFEPEWVESLSDAELSELYRTFERQAEGTRAQAELELFRQHAGRSGVTFGLVVGRRREPGEKPPKSRDRG